MIEYVRELLLWLFFWMLLMILLLNWELYSLRYMFSGWMCGGCVIFLIILILIVLLINCCGLLLLNICILKLCFLFWWFKGFVLVMWLFCCSLNFDLFLLSFINVNGVLFLGLFWLWGCKNIIFVFIGVFFLIDIVKLVCENLGGLLLMLLMSIFIWVLEDKGGCFLFWVCIVREYLDLILWLIGVVMLIMLVILLILNFFVLFFFMIL